MKRILIAEDEARVASFLTKGLAAAGLIPTVVTDGDTAAAVARDRDFDLLILDLGLPRRDGSEVLRAIRARGERLPVIILTARGEVADKLDGFQGGADDYVTKPFEFEELLARIQARLRESGRRQGPDMLSVGEVTLNLRTHVASVRGVDIELSTREFTLAETFLTHPGQVLSREHLLSRVWGYDHDPGSNIVEVYVGYLRKKLGPTAIETVRGVGYRLRRTTPPGARAE